jgi:hypothetical protein
MTQIFRIDNPLTGKGLKLGQRLCYLNAMMHFFYGVPRLVFLTAPLSFLFFGAHVIEAAASTIAIYALPHMMHASITNSRMQRLFRHSFWAEVYESVLASYITAPTLLALINPKLGKFNVTAKGGQIEKNYFDWAISRPYLFLLLLNLVGFVTGLVHIYLNLGVRSEVQTTILKRAWTGYNMLILGASVAAASERRQIRAVHRVAMKMPVMLKFSTGRTLACQTIDYSEGGVGVELPNSIQVPMHERVTVSLFRGDEEYAFPATVGFTAPGRVGLRFGEMSREQEYEFVKSTFARADAWMGWAAGYAVARPVTRVAGRRARYCRPLRTSLRRPARLNARSPNRRQKAGNEKRLTYGQRDCADTYSTLAKRARHDRMGNAFAFAFAPPRTRTRLLAGFSDCIRSAIGVGRRARRQFGACHRGARYSGRHRGGQRTGTERRRTVRSQRDRPACAGHADPGACRIVRESARHQDPDHCGTRHPGTGRPPPDADVRRLRRARSAAVARHRRPERHCLLGA